MAEEHLACFLYGPGDVRYEYARAPEVCDSHDVIVEIAFTGVCGSDVHFWVHGGIGASKLKSPLIMGHEAAGIVARVGNNVKGLSPGDRVAVEPGIPCLYCSVCKSGRYHFCAGMKFAASPPTTHGTLAKFYKTTAGFCYKLPASISLQEGVLLEPLAVAVHAVKLANVRPGMNVVVFGAGPVGLLCGAVSRVFGASGLVAVDLARSRAKSAARYLASGSYIFDPHLDVVTNASLLAADASLDGSGVDVVIETSGAASSVQTSLQLLNMGGTFVQVGMGKSEIQFPIMQVCMKELNVRGSFRYGPGDYGVARQLVAGGKISVKELITSVMPFEEVVEAWETTRRGDGIKTLIQSQV